MKIMLCLSVCLWFVVGPAVATSARAQVPAELRDRLAAIYERNEFRAATLTGAVWLDEGRRYSLLTGGARPQIVAYDSATGQSEVLASTQALTPIGASAPLAVGAYAWSTDASKLLIFTNTRRVWRQNTRGDYWVLDRGTGALRKLGGDAPEATLMFAKFSPDATRVAYVRANNIYVERLSSGAIIQLTRDGAEDVINGTSDWVNEEELDIRDGFRWSPDGNRIAYYQFDTSSVGKFTLINYTDDLYPRLTTFAYPKAGTRNSAVRIGVVAAGGGATTWMQAPGDPREHYIVRMQFLDAQTVVLLQANRLQNENRMLLASVASGSVKEAFHERSSAWIDSFRLLRADPADWFDDGRQFAWISEKDGWSHVSAITREGRQERLLTRFDADVINIVGVSPRDNLLYFIASPENPTQRYLYSAPLGGAGAPIRVTPAGLNGTHVYDLSPDGRWAFHTYSSASMPPRVDLISLPDHRSVRTLVDNEALAETLRRAGAPPVEFVQVSIGDGLTMDGYVVMPKTFAPARKYPVVVYIYGELGSVTVADRWLGNTLLFQQALADAGYIVVSFDNPGTPSPKGTKWRKTMYKAVNHEVASHQAAALRELGKGRSYLDLDRVGIYGTSGGGSNTLNALFREPDLFTVGVAMAPVPDQRLYDTIYQERYSGLPDVDKESYFKGSPINFAEGLRGHLLLMHGTGDDNVHLQGTEALVNRLVTLGKPFDEAIYPNRTHALSEGTGTTLHRWATVARYFLEHLPNGAR
jgi:dipeptidyl-peptidase-4